jgi:hypothetical protein
MKVDTKTLIYKYILFNNYTTNLFHHCEGWKWMDEAYEGGIVELYKGSKAWDSLYVTCI